MSEDSIPSGCPCGRTHRPQEKRSRRRAAPVEKQVLMSRINEARWEGKADQDVDREHLWHIHYSGNCLNPIIVPVHGQHTHVFAKQKTRCRKCKNCLEAKRRYWGNRGVSETVSTHEAGRRTWFCTLTLEPKALRRMLEVITAEHMRNESTSRIPDWLSDPKCDARFALLRNLLVKEVQKYWKRLRKEGHRFSYLLVFERHKSGNPHMHFLLHEKAGEILKKDLTSQWKHGFTKMKLVEAGGDDQLGEVRDAAWYVVKYLSKSAQSRQIASTRYGLVDLTSKR